VRILITGISGSGGSYLADYLTTLPGAEVHGLARWHSTTAADNLNGCRARLSLHECDLCDLGSVLRTLRSVQPDYIFHLAAHANVRASFDTPLAVLNNNVMGTANLLEAVRLLGTDPLLQHCSTSEVYGLVGPERVPITEDCPLNPASPYAVSKVTQDQLVHAYHQSFGLRVVRTRMFTYLNPRRADLFATSFARQVARIERGLQDELTHGNLDSVRTVIDVRDGVRAYWWAATRGRVGEVYNIGGEKTITVGEFLERLKALARCPVPSRVDPALLRPVDVTLQVPCTEKFRRDTGWKPEVPFEDSVRFLLDCARRDVAAEVARRGLAAA
jgi:GDPmannose 4,6-dehydratase/GDP-4-dehydro-6-deoxy-D-mannose reductase